MSTPQASNSPGNVRLMPEFVSVIKLCDAVFGSLCGLGLLAGLVLWWKGDVSFATPGALLAFAGTNLVISLLGRHWFAGSFELLRTAVGMVLASACYLAFEGPFERCWLVFLIMALGGSTGVGILYQRAFWGQAVTAIYAGSLLLSNYFWVATPDWHEVIVQTMGVLTAGTIGAEITAGLGRTLVLAARRRREAEDGQEALRATMVELEATRAELVDSSRKAGMAMIATNVLHNVGNALNSINVCSSVIEEKLGGSKLDLLRKTCGLLEQHRADAATFFTTDERGKQLPGFLTALSDKLERERAAVLAELAALRERVQHAKQIVAAQQAHASGGGVYEKVAIERLVQQAIDLSGGLTGVDVVRLLDPAVSEIVTDRHQTLEILVNVLTNARDAVREHAAGEPRIEIASSRRDEFLVLSVRDNGVGIAAANLAHVFEHGFTTKKTGHGFGLHSSATLAAGLKGRLFCESKGSGQGALFTLELPLQRTAEPTGRVGSAARPA